MNDSITTVKATGSSNAFNVKISGPGYYNGQKILFIANQRITGPATLQVNNKAAIVIKKLNNDELAYGEIEVNQGVLVMFDAVSNTFQMLSQVGNVANSTPVITATVDFSAASGVPETLKTFILADADADAILDITIVSESGLISITNGHGGVTTGNGTASVSIVGATAGTFTYTYTGTASETITFNATDGHNAATEKTTSVTVA